MAHPLLGGLVWAMPGVGTCGPHVGGEENVCFGFRDSDGGEEANTKGGNPGITTTAFTLIITLKSIWKVFVCV